MEKMVSICDEYECEEQAYYRCFSCGADICKGHMYYIEINIRQSCAINIKFFANKINDRYCYKCVENLFDLLKIRAEEK